MVDFDYLNRQVSEAKNNEDPRRYDYLRSDNGRMGMSPSEYLAYRNNQTYKAKNGQYPDRPYRAW